MFEIVRDDPRTLARTGRITTPHGVVETPSYVIVATDGRVRTLRASDIAATKTQIVIANTYHLWQALGDQGLNHFPGLHAYMEWDGPIMTDSGGFQVFSLGAGRAHGVSKIISRAKSVNEDDRGEVEKSLVRVTESGAFFENEGEECYLDPELSLKIQEQLGSDIRFAFDECTSPLADYGYQKEAMVRTHRWAERSLKVHGGDALLYGIVQGGPFEDLRKESSRVINSLPFQGVGIGGSFGKEEMKDVLGWTVPLLGREKPRHLLGVGRMEDIFDAVERGIDTFDCVIPTREARHGGIWTREGRIEITKGRYRTDHTPLDVICMCATCVDRSVEKCDLHMLFKEGNMEAGRLATIHNVYFFNHLMEEIRDSIRSGTFLAYKAQALSRLSSSPKRN